MYYINGSKHHSQLVPSVFYPKQKYIWFCGINFTLEEVYKTYKTSGLDSGLIDYTLLIPEGNFVS